MANQWPINGQSMANQWPFNCAHDPRHARSLASAGGPRRRFTFNAFGAMASDPSTPRQAFEGRFLRCRPRGATAAGRAVTLLEISDRLCSARDAKAVVNWAASAQEVAIRSPEEVRKEAKWAGFECQRRVQQKLQRRVQGRDCAVCMSADNAADGAQAERKRWTGRVQAVDRQ
eukprot:2436341-Prymnesium_polylepis.1